MSTPAPIASQLDLIDGGDAPLSAHAQIGFALGWDHAHYRVAPPAAYLGEASALRDGWRAGQAAFAARTLAATQQVRQWLALRLHAWLQHRSVELVELTPNYLKQIDVAHCPVTRTALSADGEAANLTIDRVRDDAGFAAGNLAAMSLKAQHAKAARGAHAAWQIAAQIEADGVAEIDGLGAAEWKRLAVLASFVEPLSHEEACALPLLVLPPNRLRLFNPVQALQAFVSQQLLTPGWSLRINRFEKLLPGDAVRADFKRFFMALLPRVLERGRLGGSPAARWAIEDAWRLESVLSRWTAFARRLDAVQCEALLCQAAARRLTTRTVVPFSSVRATEGWSLPTRGYVPYRTGASNAAGHPVHRAAAGGAMQQGRLC